MGRRDRQKLVYLIGLICLVVAALYLLTQNAYHDQDGTGRGPAGNYLTHPVFDPANPEK